MIADKKGAESKHREAGMHDRFPYFSRRLALVRLPHKFKPSNHSKYDGKTKTKAVPQNLLAIN
jgi:hypothetical protein